MKQIFTLGLSFFLCLNINSQSQTYSEWGRNFVSQNPLEIVSDPFGNVFVIGDQTVNATTPLLLDSGKFLARYNRHGELKWVKKIFGFPYTLATKPPVKHTWQEAVIPRPAHLSQCIIRRER